MKFEQTGLSKIFSNVWFLWALCLIFNIITFLFIFFKIHPGNQSMALRYNFIAGVEWYGRGKNLYFIPGAGFAITLVNFVLFTSIKQTQKFFAPLTAFISLSVQILLLAAVLFLGQIN